MAFKGYIFDLDGTLVDSKLNFELIRVDLGLDAKAPILEEVEKWPHDKKKWAHDIIDQHEVTGALESVIYPGVYEFLKQLKETQIPQAVFTRNSRKATEITLKKHNLEFHEVITRNDAPAKPDPQGLLKIARGFGLPNHKILYVGDYIYDLQAGIAAQIPTALYLSQPADFKTDGAHFIFNHFSELSELVAQSFSYS